MRVFKSGAHILGEVPANSSASDVLSAFCTALINRFSALSTAFLSASPARSGSSITNSVVRPLSLSSSVQHSRTRPGTAIITGFKPSFFAIAENSALFSFPAGQISVTQPFSS